MPSPAPASPPPVAPRRPGARRALALPLVLVVLVFLGGALGALSFWRAGVTRRLEALSVEGRLLALAEAALDEVSRDARLRAAWRDENLDRLRAAIAAGTLVDDVLTPAPVGVDLAPALTRRSIGDQPLELDDVRCSLASYEPFAGYGVLRFEVDVRSRGGKRVVSRRVVADYECSLFESGGALAFLVSRRPLARRGP